MLRASRFEIRGYVVNARGTFLVSGKVKSTVEFSAHSSLDQLPYYLCMLNFYPQFLPDFVQVLLSLAVILMDKRKTNELAYTTDP